MDLDLPNKKVRLTFAVPALLGLGGDLIQIGADQYMKISLLGPKYKKSTTTSVDVVAAADRPADGHPAGARRLAKLGQRADQGCR